MVETAVTLNQFRSAFHAGGFRSVAVLADGGEFYVTGLPRRGARVTLATTHGLRRRGFRDAGKAIAVLHAIGARTIEVDTTAWSAEEALTMRRRRPDTAERQRKAHVAASHDAWFRAEVTQALQEANDPGTEWISQEEASASWAKRRAALVARSERTAH